MFGIGMSEMLIILAVALLVFGPQKLPEIAKSIAKGLKELRRAGDDLRSSVNFDLDDDKPARRPLPRPLPKPDAPAAGLADGTTDGANATGGAAMIAGSELATADAAGVTTPTTDSDERSAADAAALPDGRAVEAPLQEGWPKVAEGTTARGDGEPEQPELPGQPEHPGKAP